LVLIASPYKYSKGIRLGEALAGDADYNGTNHAAVVRRDGGDLVESLGEGPTESHIDKYWDVPYVVIREPYTAEELARGEEFLLKVLESKARYDWLAILGAVPYVLSGGRIMLASAGASYICSALAAEYKVRTKNEYFPDRHAVFQWPSSLARHYGAKDPEYG
ncbi:MAG: hypothetical protein M3R38_36930, partial [Actinomycetota bacterium]|nr:hypothetical protein [Actinomycetota bacterium]